MCKQEGRRERWSKTEMKAQAQRNAIWHCAASAVQITLLLRFVVTDFIFHLKGYSTKVE